MNGFENWVIPNEFVDPESAEVCKASKEMDVIYSEPADDEYYQKLYSQGYLFSKHEPDNVKEARDAALDFLISYDPDQLVTSRFIRNTPPNLPERKFAESHLTEIISSVMQRYTFSDCLTNGSDMLVSYLEKLTPNQHVSTIGSMTVLYLRPTGDKRRDMVNGKFVAQRLFKVYGAAVIRQDQPTRVYGGASFDLFDPDFGNDIHTWIGPSVTQLNGSLSLIKCRVFNPFLKRFILNEDNALLDWCRAVPGIPLGNGYSNGDGKPIHATGTNKFQLPKLQVTIDQVSLVKRLRLKA